MYERFEFPLQVQQWIVQRQKRIHNWNTSLSKLGIVDGDTIHLYLLAAYSVKVTKESAEETYFVAFPCKKFHFDCSFETNHGKITSHYSRFCAVAFWYVHNCELSYIYPGHDVKLLRAD